MWITVFAITFALGFVVAAIVMIREDSHVLG